MKLLKLDEKVITSCPIIVLNRNIRIPSASFPGRGKVPSKTNPPSAPDSISSPTDDTTDDEDDFQLTGKYETPNGIPTIK
mmetsp:Transcript_7770/g.19273  ORF Transcript_7770/g.19273 Transcript_7770/m.19273 type:complete len:80 (+) Transcript_7770:1696-1935(+)